jgi:hypothetical protein
MLKIPTLLGDYWFAKVKMHSKYSKSCNKDAATKRRGVYY